MNFLPFKLGAILWGVLSVTQCLAQGGGPPMMTTDPGTPGAGNWEINGAQITTLERPESNTQLPYFDVNYGVGEKVQLKLEGGYGFLRGFAVPSHNALGPAIAGVKWRFYDDSGSGLSIAAYPQVQFPLQSLPRETTLLIPIEVLKKFQGFAINPEVGYLKALQGGPDGAYYGLAASRKIQEDWELIGEVFGVTRFNSDGSQVLVNLGTRREISHSLTLLLAAGHSVHSFAGESGQWNTYAGIQLMILRKKHAKAFTPTN